MPVLEFPYRDAPTARTVLAGESVTVKKLQSGADESNWYLIANGLGFELGWVTEPNLIFDPSCV